MKNYSNIFRTMAALLLTGAAFSACTPDEETIANRTYTMTINATQGYNDATKDLSLNPETGNIISTWNVSDEIKVKHGDDYLEGVLNPYSINGHSANLSGEVKCDDIISVDDNLILERGEQNFTSQNGTLESIAAHCDFATCSVRVESIDNADNKINCTQGIFVNQQAIVKFTFKNGNNDLSIKELTINGITMTISPATNTPYVALPAGDYSSKIINATGADDNTYRCTIDGSATLAIGQVYHIEVGMTQAK